MAHYGFFLTKQGKNVLTRQNPIDYIINSDFNTFKIFNVVGGTIEVPNGGTGTVTKVHGLTYTPAFLAFYRLKQATAVWHIDGTSLGTGDVGGDSGGYDAGVSGGTAINSSEIQFRCKDAEGSGAQIVEFKAFIFIDPIDYVNAALSGAVQRPGFGFKISKPGKNVLTAKAHELLVSSKFDSLKFHDQRTVSVTITAGGTSGSASFQHGLGYIPIITGTLEDYDDATKQRIMPFGQAPQPEAVSMKVDKSTVTIMIFQIALPGDRTYKFRVITFKNKLADA